MKRNGPGIKSKKTQITVKKIHDGEPRVRSQKTLISPSSKSATRPARIKAGFEKLWETLFSSPVHLDSALSKQLPEHKTIFAQIVPAILQRPVSLAEKLGVGVPPGEPWSLTPEQLAKWRPAHLMAERLYEMMQQGLPRVTPCEEDFPPWMIQEWKTSWGEKATADLIQSLAKEAPLSLRASQKMGSARLVKELEPLISIRAKTSEFAPWGVRLPGYSPILNTELYKGGAFEIQDEGSQVMAVFALWPHLYKNLLKNKPENIDVSGSCVLPDDNQILKASRWNVVDTCAGAGGKSLALADALGGKGRVYAYDISEKKLQALRRRATRAGLNNIQAVSLEEGAEEKVIHQFQGSADVVLVDAPCSGWGVLRRNPDIKWRQRSDTLTRMPEIQLRLLSLYSNLVAPKGRLVFGVCTIRRAESVDLVEAFLKANPNFERQDGGFLGPNPTDGFFMQSFVRVK